jgi:hypothetical protein
MSDWYSRLMLTIIAVAVVVIAAQGIIEHIEADRAAQAIANINGAH